MAKSNWYGSSGWTAINDPTGVLDGRVLVVAAGSSAVAEDYLTQVVGTSTAFSTVHYEVGMDYAVFQSSDVTSMQFGLIARAGNFGGTPTLSRDCYIAKIDVGNQTASLIRRYSGTETILSSAGLTNSSAYSIGTTHNISLTAVGITSVNLSLKVDGNELISVGDTQSQKLVSGFPGIYASSGRIYADNFTIKEYTSTGGVPESWTPSNLSAGVTLSLWLKGDTGLTGTTTGSDFFVSGWADQSGNSNDASQGTTAAKPTTVPSGLNNYQTLRFDGTDDFMQISDAATLDMQAFGVSIFIMAKPIGTAGSNDRMLFKDGTYDTGLDGAGNETTFSNGTTVVYGSGNSYTNDNFQIFEVVSNDSYYVNGTAVTGVTSISLGADNSNQVLISSASGSDFLNAEYAEIVMVQGNVSDGDRQKIEGYLAQKYGTWPSLPSDHPYRTIAPTVS